MPALANASALSDAHLLPPLHVLLQREGDANFLWNKSRTAVLVGLKAWRDFRPYRWPLHQLGFQVRNRHFALPSTARARDSVVLCHSLLTSKCFHANTSRPATLRASSAPSAADGASKAWLAQGFSLLQSSQRVNRVLAAHTLLTSKDGMCHSLRYVASVRSRLGEYTFPCYVVPDHRKQLLMDLASHPHQRWISKPVSGSQGSGIVVLNASELHSKLLLLPHLLTRTRSRIVTPYMAEPMLSQGRKWDLRSYVLVTSVVPYSGLRLERIPGDRRA